VERGPYVSYANCGLPYHIGGVIEEEASLFVVDEALFRDFFNINVRTRCEVVAIKPESKTVDLLDIETGTVSSESYDKLVLSPGAATSAPPVPGIDLPGLFPVRTVPDAREINGWIEARSAKRAVVIGGGFIGLEMAENLVHRGLEVTIVEMLDQVMAPLDRECALLVERHMEQHGVQLALDDGVAGIQESASGNLEVLTQKGELHPADIVIIATGVRPDTSLAKSAGLEIGESGGIRVDEQMRTSNPDIFAVGDAIEVKNFVTKEMTTIPLAGPANRQGRIAAEVIAGRNSRFRGSQGTAIVGVFGLTVASTGASEKLLIKRGEDDYEKIYLYPNSHAGYYPGAKPLSIKVLFRKTDGLLLGAQAIGEVGVDKRIDVFAMAIQMGCTVYDLEESELCYAPPFGSAKDPSNFAGMIAADVLRNDMPVSHWDGGEMEFVLDVRTPPELMLESVPGAVNIPLEELRERLDELPRDREIHIVCRTGQRSYYATRILMQKGFKARNISGGMFSRAHMVLSNLSD
jgi:NADPH-dependent 2,4-dienoyl-CoA reductase/sulfur reductase-like enzyme/rhodanese-related sulfurtransferase